MKIYTKQGDKGLTSLYDCSRISKSSDIIDLIGDLDELNSFIGVINSKDILEDIQTWIFDLSTIIANPKHKYIFDNEEVIIKLLEKEIDRLTAELPKLKNFILPSGNIHIARAVARKCERKLVAMIENGNNDENNNRYTHIQPNCLVFLNRLSDYLFTLARHNNVDNEIIYKKSSILTTIS
jgi:cob(I)alamin adenosyltransferase